jgi:hypothetical protein
VATGSAWTNAKGISGTATCNNSSTAGANGFSGLVNSNATALPLIWGQQ